MVRAIFFTQIGHILRPSSFTSLPFALLPYVYAFIVWDAITLLCCIAVVYLIVRRISAIVLVLASPFTAWVLLAGQNGFLLTIAAWCIPIFSAALAHSGGLPYRTSNLQAAIWLAAPCRTDRSQPVAMFTSAAGTTAILDRRVDRGVRNRALGRVSVTTRRPEQL